MRNNNIYKIYVAGVVLLSTTLITLGILAKLHKDETKPQKMITCSESCRDVKIKSGGVSHITINNDTTRRLYMINDTMTNILWIGVGGKMITK